jgi:integrase
MAQPSKAPNGVFYIRRKVPEALRTALGREYKRSLNTRDADDAKRLFAIEWVKSEEAFALARAQAAGVLRLDQKDVQILVQRWFDSELSKMESSGKYDAWLATGGTVAYEQGDRYEEHTPYITMRDAIASDPDLEATLNVDSIVRAALRANNIPMPSMNSAEYRALIDRFVTKALELSDTAFQRHSGKWDVVNLPLKAEPLSFETKRLAQSASKDLLKVFEEYEKDRLLTDGDTRAVKHSLAGARAQVEEFIELCGNLPVTQITRSVVTTYRAEIAQLPSKGKGIRKLSAKQKQQKARDQNLPLIEAPTIKNKVRAISAVLSFALRMDYVQENPIIASGISRATAKAAAKKTGKAARNFYDKEELALIFSSPVFTDSSWKPPRANFGRAWYWVPLLMYYTGARREEIAQLAVKDVRSDSPDVARYLSILNTEGEEDGNRGVKNESSRRSIPLHDDLIDRGFLAYVDAQPKSGQLFPELKPNPDGYYGANFGKRWAEYLRQVVGLKCTADPSHGFRHTFKTLCRQVDIAEEVSDAITGHSGGSRVARGYGEMPLSRMSEELKKFPRLGIGTFITNTDKAP